MVQIDRRRFLLAAGTGATAMSFPELDPFLAEQTTRSSQTLRTEWANVKACVFDTFGTVVDWRNSIIA